MNETETIHDQLRRAHEDGAWLGASLHQLLAGVNAETAARRPIPTAHTIWEIALHIGTWEDVFRHRLQGKAIGDLTPEEDWPAIGDPTGETWQATRSRLEQGHRELRRAVLAFPATRLDETVPGRDFTFRVMIEGAVHHALYHGGQIGILAKGGV